MWRVYMECGGKRANANAPPLCDIRKPLTFRKIHNLNKLIPFVLVFILLII
jgi:hypothetical protein